MIEVGRQNIIAVIPDRINQTVEVGLVRTYQREGDGGTFRKAYLYENFETVLEDAAGKGLNIRLEFSA